MAEEKETEFDKIDEQIILKEGELTTDEISEKKRRNSN